MDLCKIHRFVAIRDKELRRKLTPDYDIGCKRPSWSNDYYRSFTKPHVHLETGGIERIEPDGIVTNDGHEDRSSTPWCWPPDSICGTPTSRPSR